MSASTVDRRAETAPPERASGAALFSWCAAVALAAVLVLVACAPLFDPDRLHVHSMYTDQAGYVTTARILADTGELRNGILLPSQLGRTGVYVHMPGHAVALALAYRAFGYGVFQTLLPSLAGYVLAAVGTFLIANRLYGRRAGALAALLFALFPANVAYAFTAMAELSFTAACVAAFAVFVHLPKRLWPYAMPVLLVLPFLFRESGAFLVLPMALLVLHARGFLAAGLATAGTVAALWLVNRWQIASGKVAASLAWVTGESFNYGDLYAAPPPELSLGEWIAAAGRNAERNWRLLERHAERLPGELMPWCLYALVAVAAVALAGGAARRRKDPFPLGAGLLLALVFALTVALYDAKLHKPMRSAMFAWPLGAVAIAGLARPDALAARLSSARPAARLAARAAAGLLAAAAVWGSFTVCRLAGRVMTNGDAAAAAYTEILAWLHDPRTVIVAPTLAAQYAVERYPVVWSMQPANEATFEALLERVDVGAILMEEPLSEAFIARHALVPADVQRKGPGRLFLYAPRERVERLQAGWTADGSPAEVGEVRGAGDDPAGGR